MSTLSIASYDEGTSAIFSDTSSFFGFGSSLSHTNILHHNAREEDDDDTVLNNVNITGEELSSLGVPVAKVGVLSRKQFQESHGKRAKSRTWLDIFAVIHNGELNMFNIGGGSRSTNNTLVGKVDLTQSLAHVLPPPGYNSQRPHCFVLTLGNGAVYFFQADSQELVYGWASACNNWAARQSKEPLMGGISNIEYGWSRVLDAINEETMVIPPSLTRDTSHASDSSRGRVEFDSIRGVVSPYGDRVVIQDWNPPIPSTLRSMRDGWTQLEALRKHVAMLQTSLQQHNELRLPMMQLYQPRYTNASKALANWESKAKYLLTETIKYKTYVGLLDISMTQRVKKRREKASEKILVSAHSGGPGGAGSV